MACKIFNFHIDFHSASIHKLRERIGYTSVYSVAIFFITFVFHQNERNFSQYTVANDTEWVKRNKTRIEGEREIEGIVCEGRKEKERERDFR